MFLRTRGATWLLLASAGPPVGVWQALPEIRVPQWPLGQGRLLSSPEPPLALDSAADSFDGLRPDIGALAFIVTL